jgi:hypothetical protein
MLHEFRHPIQNKHGESTMRDEGEQNSGGNSGRGASWKYKGASEDGRKGEKGNITASKALALEVCIET